MFIVRMSFDRIAEFQNGFDFFSTRNHLLTPVFVVLAETLVRLTRTLFAFIIKNKY